ncbi:proprotein convertase P-domain-containing protein [Streptomyces sp. SID13031]|uniref:proprotein convertase P-domain-containing protein n=1 Tax=Streptomyces sp. SID13031 TaxID=2706046 RepID=UPI0013CC260C|nr:proprotein convertase P-domain-containing protein [Streptomyces sp. SID13031]NEA36875.1 hypothetical protein [Streptomyces sp. SID13031]
MSKHRVLANLVSALLVAAGVGASAAAAAPSSSAHMNCDWYGWYENSTRVAIPDGPSGEVSSPIPVTGLCGSAAMVTVNIEVRHSFRGDLLIDLVAPDGTSYRVKSPSGWDSADDVVGTYRVRVVGGDPTGTWRLRVKDVCAADTGRIEKWSLEF